MYARARALACVCVCGGGWGGCMMPCSPFSHRPFLPVMPLILRSRTTHNSLHCQHLLSASLRSAVSGEGSSAPADSNQSAYFLSSPHTNRLRKPPASPITVLYWPPGDQLSARVISFSTPTGRELSAPVAKVSVWWLKSRVFRPAANSLFFPLQTDLRDAGFCGIFVKLRGETINKPGELYIFGASIILAWNIYRYGFIMSSWMRRHNHFQTVLLDTP